MTKFVTIGLFAFAFATSALVASTVFAQGRSPLQKRAPSTFDGQVVTRALVRDIAARDGLAYAWHDYCRSSECARLDGAFGIVAAQAPGSALLFLEWRGAQGEPEAAILGESRCDAPRALGVRSIRTGAADERVTGVRSIRSRDHTGDCLGGYQVLARFELNPS